MMIKEHYRRPLGEAGRARNPALPRPSAEGEAGWARGGDPTLV